MFNPTKAIEKIKDGSEVIRYANHTLFCGHGELFVVMPEYDEKSDTAFAETFEKKAEFFETFRAALNCLLSK